MSNAIGVTTANRLARHWSEPTITGDKKPVEKFSILGDIANLLRNHTNSLVDDSGVGTGFLTAIREDNPNGDDWKNPEIEITANVGNYFDATNDFNKEPKWTLLYKNEEEDNDIFRFNWTDELKDFIKTGNIKGIHLGGLYENKKDKKMKNIKESHVQGTCPICGEDIHSSEGVAEVLIDGKREEVHEYHCTDESLEALYDYCDKYWATHDENSYSAMMRFKPPLCKLKESRKLREKKVAQRTKRPSKEKQLWDSIMNYLIEIGDAKENTKNVYPEDGFFFRWETPGVYKMDQEDAEKTFQYDFEVIGDMYHLILSTYYGEELGIWEGESLDEFIVDFDEMQHEMKYDGVDAETLSKYTVDESKKISKKKIKESKISNDKIAPFNCEGNSLEKYLNDYTQFKVLTVNSTGDVLSFYGNEQKWRVYKEFHQMPRAWDGYVIETDFNDEKPVQLYRGTGQNELLNDLNDLHKEVFGKSFHE